jgi:hypothetical protein
VEWVNEPAKWSERRFPVTFDDLNVTQAAQPS